jgi:hypothetical protein
MAAGCALDSRGSEGSEGSGGTGGAASSGVACLPGETTNCYTGSAETLRGACRSGTRSCVAGAWGACEGEVLPAVEDCAAPGDEDCDGLAPPCQSWARVLADPGAGDVRAAAFGARGGALIAGWVQGQFDFGAGPQATNGVDALLLRLDASGALTAAQTFGDGKTQLGQSVALGGDGTVAFAGRFRGAIFGDVHQLFSEGHSNLFVARFASDGVLAWTRAIGSLSNDDGIAVALDSTSRTVLAANVAGPSFLWTTPLAHAGSVDVALASLDTAGNVLWAKVYGDADNQTVNAITVAPGDDVILVGSMRGALDTGNGPMTAVGGSDGFVARVRADGSGYWSRSFGGSGDEAAAAVVAVPGGGLCIGGSFSSVSDFGKLHWARRIGGQGDDVGAAVAAGPDGGCIVAGSFEGTALAETMELVSSGGSDGFVVRYDLFGEPVFTRSIGGRGDQAVSVLGSDGAGGLLVGGRASISVDLGDGKAPTMVSGDSDAFLVRLAPPG